MSYGFKDFSHVYYIDNSYTNKLKNWFTCPCAHPITHKSLLLPLNIHLRAKMRAKKIVNIILTKFLNNLNKQSTLIVEWVVLICFSNKFQFKDV